MTIQSETSKAVYIADGKTSSFEIPFYFFNKDIAVYKGDEATALEEGKDYEIEHYENSIGGTITMFAMPQKEEKITILRNVELTQLIKFMEGEDFPASDYEYSLDKMIMALQQLREHIKRAVVIGAGSEITPEDLYEFLVLLDKNFEEIKKLPEKIKDMETMFARLLNFTTEEVTEGDERLITSGGVWQHLKDRKYSNIKVPTSSIVSDSMYEEYPYRADIEIAGAKAGDIPMVVFDIDEAVSGNYAPIALAEEGKVCIYMKIKPSGESLTIPSLILH